MQFYSFRFPPQTIHKIDFTISQHVEVHWCGNGSDLIAHGQSVKALMFFLRRMRSYLTSKVSKFSEHYAGWHNGPGGIFNLRFTITTYYVALSVIFNTRPRRHTTSYVLGGINTQHPNWRLQLTIHKTEPTALQLIPFWQDRFWCPGQLRPCLRKPGWV